MRNPWWPDAGLGGSAEPGGSGELGGAGVGPGPSADAVAVVAQRLAGIARDFDALRLQLMELDGTDWQSPAASAFRQSLDACVMALAVAVRKVDSAGSAVGSYGIFLQSESAAAARNAPCAAPNRNVQGTGGGTKFGPRFGQGFESDWGAGF